MGFIPLINLEEITVCPQMLKKKCKDKASIFVISSPSGGGKTTICRYVMNALPRLQRSLSLTTRKIRKGERKNIDYRFVSKDEFLEKIKRNTFAEWAKVLDNYYGTSKEVVETYLSQGKDVILNIDVQGALQIKKVYPRAITIFILPSSLNVLKKRLRGRNTDTRAEIDKRLALAKKELFYVPKYDYAVVNDSLKRAVEKVKSIIIAERCKVRK